MEKILLTSISVVLCLYLTMVKLSAMDYQTTREKVKELRKSNPEKAIITIEEALDEQVITAFERAELNYLQGEIYYFELSDKENALGQFYNALKHFRLAKIPKREYDCLIAIALSFHNLFHYDLAVSYFEEALNVSGLDTLGIKRAEYNLARTLRTQKKYSQAEIILKQLCGFYETTNNMGRLYSSKTALALNYLDSGAYGESLRLYNDVLDYAESNNDQSRKSRAINSIGFIKLKQKEFREAEEFLLSGLELKKGSANQQSLLVSYLNLGELYTELQKPAQAIKYYQLGSELDPSAVNHLNFIEALEQLILISKDQNDLVSVVKYHEQIAEIQKPYVALNERLEQMHARYRAERVKYMHDQLELKDQLIQSQNRNIIIGIILFVVTIIAAVVVIIQQRKRAVDKSLRAWLMEKNKLLYFIAGRYKLDLKEVQKELENR